MHEEGKQINPITDNFQFCQIADFWLVLTVVRICLCYWLYKTCWPKKLTTAIIDIWRWNTHGQNPTCTGLFLTNRKPKEDCRQNYCRSEDETVTYKMQPVLTVPDQLILTSDCKANCKQNRLYFWSADIRFQSQNCTDMMFKCFLN